MMIVFICYLSAAVPVPQPPQEIVIENRVGLPAEEQRFVVLKKQQLQKQLKSRAEQKFALLEQQQTQKQPKPKAEQKFREQCFAQPRLFNRRSMRHL